MTLTDDDIATIRAVIRQELRRERAGIRCPECGQKQMAASAYDEFHAVTTEVWACQCGFEAPPEEFEHAEPSLTD